MKTIGICVFALSALFAQTTGASFEVVSIKASPANDGHFTRGCKGGPGSNDPSLWQCTNTTIALLIMRAYQIKRYQLTAPDWTLTTNYEISAKVPPDTTQEQFREMIRHLLSDRFRVELHSSKKEMAAYDLVLARGGSKLKESIENRPNEPNEASSSRGGGGRGAAQDADGYPNIPDDCRGCMAINAAGKARYRSTRESLKMFADIIANQLGVPVIDKTGLTGRYDITLSWNSGGGIDTNTASDSAADAGITIEAAVQEQLGLKLISAKEPIDILVLDKAQRVPSEN
jgi:uncharacterized protein (TIGR03435 family)